MAILLHPSKEKPERYRVWDRGLKVQRYFPLTAKGKKSAENEEMRIQKRKRFKSIKDELSVNKLFDSDDNIKGLKRKIRERDGLATYEYFALYACKKQSEITIGDSFDDAYQRATDWLLEMHGIESTLEIRLIFKKAKKKYRYQSLLKSQLHS